MTEGFGLVEVEALRAALAAGVGAMDPDAVLASEAPGLWAGLDGIERLAATAKTLLARRVADSRVWATEGYSGPAAYLARRSGTTPGRARETLEASKRLADQPVLSDAARAGELSAGQTALIADAVTADPSAASRLVKAASTSTVAELREACARIRAAADPDPEATHRRIHAKRCLRRHTDTDGTWCLTVRGTPDAGARFGAALDPIIDDIFRTARAEGRREPHDAYAFDALIELADRARNGGTTRRSGPPIWPCYASTSKRCAEARWKATSCVRSPGSAPSRSVSPSTCWANRSSNWSSPGASRWPTSPTSAEAPPWPNASPCCGCHPSASTKVATGGGPRSTTASTGPRPTTPASTNLDRLCVHDHQLKTHHRWALIPGTGRRAFVPPTDPRHPDHVSPPGRTGPAPPHTLLADTG